MYGSIHTSMVKSCRITELMGLCGAFALRNRTSFGLFVVVVAVARPFGGGGLIDRDRDRGDGDGGSGNVVDDGGSILTDDSVG